MGEASGEGRAASPQTNSMGAQRVEIIQLGILQPRKLLQLSEAWAGPITGEPKAPSCLHVGRPKDRRVRTWFSGTALSSSQGGLRRPFQPQLEQARWCPAPLTRESLWASCLTLCPSVSISVT